MARQTVPHNASIVLVGELVERARILTPGATEWPKVGCRVKVNHGPDQATVFNVVTIGLTGDAMLHAKLGSIVQIGGQIKAATGALEVFAVNFEMARAQGAWGYRSMFGGFGGGTAVEGDEWKKDSDDEDDK